MNRSEKARLVEELSRRVGEAKCLYLTDFTGLDVASMTELRARLSGAEVEYVVVKNTLARRALEESPYAELSEHLAGPNAFAMSNVDVVSPAKILTDFAREREKPAIKAGAIEGRIVSIDEIRRIAELPPREELLAQLVGYAKAPMAGLVYALNGLLSKFVRTLDAVRARKEEEGGEEASKVEAGEAPEVEAEEAGAEATMEAEEATDTTAEIEKPDVEEEPEPAAEPEEATKVEEEPEAEEPEPEEAPKVEEPEAAPQAEEQEAEEQEAEEEKES